MCRFSNLGSFFPIYWFDLLAIEWIFENIREKFHFESGFCRFPIVGQQCAELKFC